MGVRSNACVVPDASLADYQRLFAAVERLAQGFSAVGDSWLPTLLEQLFPNLGVDAPLFEDVKSSTRGTHGPMSALTDELVGVLGDRFLFAVQCRAEPALHIDGQRAGPMRRVPGREYWVAVERLATGRTHSYQFFVEGRGCGVGDVAGYGPASEEQAQVPRGRLHGPFTVVSEVYPGTTTEYWLYINAGVDKGKEAPVMVWHDGSIYLGVSDLLNYRLKIVSDNLVHDRLIPPMVHILVSPSTGGVSLPARFRGVEQRRAIRSIQYDTVSDLYGHHLLREVLPHAEHVQPLRKDGYSRGSAGFSSGGTCAFTLSWFHPAEFSRAHSSIGSFTDLLWDPEGSVPGASIYSTLVRQQRKNIRVWLSEGSRDLVTDADGPRVLFQAGSWPINNIQLADSLKLAGYDFHFRYGCAGHNAAQGSLDLPESLAWLWRDYDATRTEQQFEQQPSERAQPAYEISIINRDLASPN